MDHANATDMLLMLLGVLLAMAGYLQLQILDRLERIEKFLDIHQPDEDDER